MEYCTGDMVTIKIIEYNYNDGYGNSVSQRQQPEMFYNKRRSWKFCIINSKTPVSECPF